MTATNLIDRHRYYIDKATFERSTAEQQTTYLKEHALQLIDEEAERLSHQPTLPDKAEEHEWRAPAWALRGSLFQIIPKKFTRIECEYDKPALVVNHDARFSIQTLGPALSLSDRMVWMEMLAQLQYSYAGQWLKVKNKPTLAAVGTGYGSDTITKLKKSLIRLSQADINYLRKDHQGQKQVQYITPLLYYDELTHSVALPPTLMLLLLQEHRNYEELRGVQKKHQLHHISLNKKTHCKLQMEISRWVHGWFASHENWIPLPLHMLLERAGAQIEETKHKNAMYKKLLEDLQQIQEFGHFKVAHNALIGQKCDD